MVYCANYDFPLVEFAKPASILVAETTDPFTYTVHICINNYPSITSKYSTICDLKVYYVVYYSKYISEELYIVYE